MIEAFYVVPAERHVERLARAGLRAETRTSLRERLATALLPGVRFADARETRLTLALALEEPAKAAQLDLFAAQQEESNPLLTALLARGGASWVRAVTAIDEAIGVLRTRGANPAHLERVARASGKSGRDARVASGRAEMLALAMRALDAALGRAGAQDARLLGHLLAPAIRAAGAARVAEIVGAVRVRARWILAWDPHDLEWWRALDETLAQGGGYARVVLPAFDKPLEGARLRDPFEVIADAVSRRLDAAPETETIAAVLGDLGATAPSPDPGRVRLLRVTDANHQAQAAVQLVRQALDAGARVERIAIAYPSRDERTLLPLRRALARNGIVFYDALGPPPSSVAVVAAALHALTVQESPDRTTVARLLRSGYIDAPRLLGDESLSFREAEEVLARFARALETRATAAASNPEDRLVLTAIGPASEVDEPRMRRVVRVLLGGEARTRIERLRAARVLFHELGFAARAGRGALGTFARDDAPSGVDRREREAVARDVRAWEYVEAALDAYETVALRAGERAIAPEVFRLELAELLEASGGALPSAGRAGAVRIVRLADVAGDEHDLLVVLDVNDGIVPRDTAPNNLVSESLEEGVARVARDSFVRSGADLTARDLAALATSAAEAVQVALVTTAEDEVSMQSVASPSRIFLALERAGLVVETPPSGEPLQGSGGTSIALRVARERAREGFFLDPARPQSDVVGTLATSATVSTLIGAATGDSASRALAVTSLERFAQCPFKGYAHVVLAAREGEEQSELPDAREEGNLGHSALAAAFVATKDEWPRRPRAAQTILERGLAAADTVLERASAGHAPLRAIVRLRVRESVRAVLLRAIDDVDWDFILAEQAFQSRSSTWPPFETRDASHRLWLRGSIDRIDRAHTTAPSYRVIDYKRSKSTVRDATAMLGETALQVPIYAAVAARRFEAPALGIYLPMQPRDLAAPPAKSTARVEARIADLVRREAGPTAIEARALAVVASARAGRFAPTPARESECTRCSVSGGCRKPRFAMAPDDLEESETP